MRKTLFPLLALCLLLSGCGGTPSADASAEFFAMDTVMQLETPGLSDPAAVTAGRDAVETLEALLSRTDGESEISRLNGADGRETPLSYPTAALLAAARDCSLATDGAFDPTVAPVMDAWGFTTDSPRVPDAGTLSALLPLVDSAALTVTVPAPGEDGSAQLAPGQAVDLGGIAKGYASDWVEAALRRNGAQRAMVYLGGNVLVLGTKADGSAWRVAVQDPEDPSAYAGILTLTDAFAVTSGGYQRYFEENGVRYQHILDPKTGYPAESGLTSVTVVAAANGPDYDSDTPAPGSGAMCDAFSTALFVLGEEKALDFWRTSGYAFELVLVTEDGRVLVTEGLADRFEQTEGSAYRYELIPRADEARPG